MAVSYLIVEVRAARPHLVVGAGVVLSSRMRDRNAALFAQPSFGKVRLSRARLGKSSCCATLSTKWQRKIRGVFLSYSHLEVDGRGDKLIHPVYKTPLVVSVPCVYPEPVLANGSCSLLVSINGPPKGAFFAPLIEVVVMPTRIILHLARPV